MMKTLLNIFKFCLVIATFIGCFYLPERLGITDSGLSDIICFLPGILLGFGFIAFSIPPCDDPDC